MINGDGPSSNRRCFCAKGRRTNSGRISLLAKIPHIASHTLHTPSIDFLALASNVEPSFLFAPASLQTMEQPFRCNNQTGGYCRAVLTEEAVVTTCSQVSMPCLTHASMSDPVCPGTSFALPARKRLACLMPASITEFVRSVQRDSLTQTTLCKPS